MKLQTLVAITLTTAGIIGVISGSAVYAVDTPSPTNGQSTPTTGTPPLSDGSGSSSGSSSSCGSAAECIKTGVTQAGGSGETRGVGDFLKIITNVLLFLLGSGAVIMIVIGGVKYTTSQGDQAALTSAKNTILYSVIGLAVAIMAYAIVNFVIERFKGDGGAAPKTALIRTIG